MGQQGCGWQNLLVAAPLRRPPPAPPCPPPSSSSCQTVASPTLHCPCSRYPQSPALAAAAARSGPWCCCPLRRLLLAPPCRRHCCQRGPGGSAATAAARHAPLSCRQGLQGSRRVRERGCCELSHPVCAKQVPALLRRRGFSEATPPPDPPGSPCRLPRRELFWFGVWACAPSRLSVRRGSIMMNASCNVKEGLVGEGRKCHGWPPAQPLEASQSRKAGLPWLPTFASLLDRLGTGFRPTSLLRPRC